MECNFFNKIEEIKKVFNCWINRTLSVYGKIVIIKTLGLSKLSHLALVLPDLNKKQLKQIESIIFKFLWGNKPDKVSREHAKLSEQAGGLGVVDIKSFRQALKFSWLRRCLNTSAFWPNILIDEVKNVIGQVVTISDILQLGPNRLNFIAKKIKNKFWSEVLLTVSPTMQGAIFCHPENLITAPLWDNPLITRNNKALKKTAYPGWSDRVTTMSDFYHPGTKITLDRADFQRKYDVSLSEETYLEFKYIFQLAQSNLGIIDNSLVSTFYPHQPLLIGIANLVQKGCNVYYKILRKKINLGTTLSVREEKWHNELNCTFIIDFWNKTYNLTSNIKNDNKLKFLQYQINRNSLYTNYRVNKFKNDISPYCTFCSGPQSLNPPFEVISHLFHNCSISLNLWIEVGNWLRGLNIDIPLNRNILLFGYHEQPFNSVVNYNILCVKYFIWKSKFKSQELHLRSYQYFLRGKLDDLKNAYLYEGKDHKFDPYVTLYDNLLKL